MNTPISFPKNNPHTIPKGTGYIIVSIEKQGAIYLNDSEIQQLNLKKKLEILFSNRSKKEIFLKADSLIPYGNVMRVMDLIRSSGIKKISMVTEPIKRNKSR